MILQIQTSSVIGSSSGISSNISSSSSRGRGRGGGGGGSDDRIHHKRIRESHWLGFRLPTTSLRSLLQLEILVLVHCLFSRELLHFPLSLTQLNPTQISGPDRITNDSSHKGEQRLFPRYFDMETTMTTTSLLSPPLPFLSSSEAGQRPQPEL